MLDIILTCEKLNVPIVVVNNTQVKELCNVLKSNQYKVPMLVLNELQFKTLFKK